MILVHRPTLLLPLSALLPCSLVGLCASHRSRGPRSPPGPSSLTHQRGAVLATRTSSDRGAPATLQGAPRRRGIGHAPSRRLPRSYGPRWCGFPPGGPLGNQGLCGRCRRQCTTAGLGIVRCPAHRATDAARGIWGRPVSGGAANRKLHRRAARCRLRRNFRVLNQGVVATHRAPIICT
jgi:hypothetical protein